MKKFIIILIAVMFLAGCSTNPLSGKRIEIVDPTAEENIIIELDELDTATMSDEQIAALIMVADGLEGLDYLMRSELFDIEFLKSLGVTTGLNGKSGFELGEGIGEGLGEGDFDMGGIFSEGQIPEIDFSSLNIDDLNFDGLSDEQINLIEQLLDEDLTLEEFLATELVSMQQLREVGILGAKGGFGGGRFRETEVED